VADAMTEPSLNGRPPARHGHGSAEAPTVFIVQAESRVMNPTIAPSIIAEAMARDPVAGLPFLI
jgi:hypothetical protein